MRLSLIVAASANDVIGVRGELPWHLPDDFRYFKETTMGSPLIMGRRTYESIGRPLPGRLNIVLTRGRNFAPEGVAVAHSADAALALAGDADEVFVIGGGEVYRQFMDRAERIYLTRVHVELDGDTTFPVLAEREWRLVSSDAHPADARHAYDFEFTVYDRW